MELIFRKIKNIRLASNLTQTQYSEVSGINQADISRVEGGKKEFLPNVYIQFLYKEGVDLNWLFDDAQPAEPVVYLARNGARKPARNSQKRQNEKYIFKSEVVNPIDKTPILKPEQEKFDSVEIEAYIRGEKIRPVVVAVDSHKRDNIFIIDSKASAGLPANHDNPHYFESMPSFYFPGSQYRNGTFIMIQATGDSMYPTILQGDYLLGRFVDDWYTLKDNSIIICVTRSGVVVKRILNRLNDRKTLVMMSDNEILYRSYEEFVYNIYQIYEVQSRLSNHLENERKNLTHEIEVLKSDYFYLRNELEKLKDK